MFERILIKSGSNAAERFLSIADLVDMMFYYGEVHALISQFELKQLLNSFGVDVLYDLITTKRLFVHPCDQHIGASKYGDFESVGLFRRNFNSIEELLFNFHKETVNDIDENKRFAEKFSKVLDEYRYPQAINESLYADVENDKLLSQATQVFVKQYYPNYRDIENIQVKADSKVSSFMSFYKIEGNLRIDELNELHRQQGYGGSFGYSTILMALGETHVDCYLSSELKAEMMANNRWTEIYKLRMNQSISQAEGSMENIDHFREMSVNEYLSPGQAFEAGLITSKELLKDLNSRDSVKFREWLSKIPEGQPLAGELYKEMQALNSNKKWIKGSRSLSQVVTSIINPVLGAAHTFLDSFVGDRLINGWKPSLFVSNILTKEQYQRKSAS